MTAPDDVRARFEAWHDAKWPKPKVDHPYLQEVAEFHWRQQKAKRLEIWQAAHADLSGEVWELVEALDVARGKVNHVHLSLANNRVVGGSFSMDDETSCRWMGSLNIAGARLDDVRRRLAKFTHQERTNG